jgi:hypothetical protein
VVGAFAAVNTIRGNIAHQDAGQPVVVDLFGGVGDLDVPELHRGGHPVNLDIRRAESGP